jgi:predicted transposase/invertase (TIGR01784 family)
MTDTFLPELLPRTSDYVFKAIFGKQSDTTALKGFLQQVLSLPAEEYKKVVIVDPETKAEKRDDKTSILDVKVITTSGHIVEVEIQVQPAPDMKKRVIMYNARMVTEQMMRGQKYEKLKKAINIIVCDHTFIAESAAYHNCFELYDAAHQVSFGDTIIEIHTLELPKLPKRNDDSGLWEWMRFLRTESPEELQDLARKDPGIAKAVETMREITQDDILRHEADSRMAFLWDQASRERGAREEGLAEGEKRGLAKGESRGLTKGEKRGKAEAARNALALGLSIEQVASITGLSANEISRLKPR